MGETVEQMIPRIAGLRRRVRQAGGLVVHTQSVRKPDSLEFTLFKNVVRKVEGTWGAEFVDELKPEPHGLTWSSNTRTTVSIEPRWNRSWSDSDCGGARDASSSPV